MSISAFSFVKMEKVFLFWQKPIGYVILKDCLERDGWRVGFLSDTGILEEYIKRPVNEKKIDCCCLAILNPTHTVFTAIDVKRLHEFCRLGNNLIVASGDNEDGTNETNLSDIAAPFGVKFNQDCVILPNPFDCYHPKEAHLQDFIANRSLNDTMLRHLRNKTSVNPLFKDGLSIIYASGCTLSVDSKISTIMMTSSKWSIPNEQAICSFYKGDSSSTGCRMIALGSSAMFNDNYISKENNEALWRALLEFVCNDDYSINISDAKTIEIPEYICTPDMDALIEIPIGCLEKSAPLPENKSALIDRNLFSIDCSMLPTILNAYKELDVPHEPLALIKPNLSRFPLKLKPATYGFMLRKWN